MIRHTCARAQLRQTLHCSHKHRIVLIKTQSKLRHLSPPDTCPCMLNEQLPQLSIRKWLLCIEMDQLLRILIHIRNIINQCSDAPTHAHGFVRAFAACTHIKTYVNKSIGHNRHQATLGSCQCMFSEPPTFVFDQK